MARQCGCLGGNENCTRCFGLGYIQDDADYDVGTSWERRTWGPRSTPPTQRRRELRAAGAQIKFTVPIPGESRKVVRSSQPWSPPFGCPYCKARFISDQAREIHIEAHHVAESGDQSESARAKPLVRISGRIMERRRLSQSSPDAIRTKPVTPPSGRKESAIPERRADAQVFAAGRGALLQCPDCKSKVRASRLEKHLRMVHGHQKAIAAASAKPPTPTTTPLVGTGLSRAIQGNSNPAKSFQSKLARTARRPDLVPCPMCSSDIRPDRLKRHLVVVHQTVNSETGEHSNSQRPRKLSRRVASGGPTRYKALSMGSGVSGPSGGDEDERLAELDNYWEERRLDGSRDYWQIREDGRFGSHPSFDSCDDESAP